MKRYKLLIPLLFTISAMAGREPAAALSGLPLLITVADIESPAGKLLRYYPESGPATMYLRDSVSVSCAVVGWDYNHQSQTISEQNGSGYNLYRIELNSYHKLSRYKSTVWGHALYASGNTNDVKFTDCIDCNLLAPYVLGDDTGGTLTHQQYVFGGGWSRSYGEWATGVSADYRAEIAHRPHDPRVRDIVSDLSINLGGSRSIGNLYQMAIDASLRIYHQNCDIDYYNPANTIMTRLLTGLGSVYNRFDNNQCNSSGHNLTGFGAGISLMPRIASTGLRVHIGVTNNKAETELRDLNNIIPGHTSTSIINGSVTWYSKGKNGFSFLPTIKGTLFDRNGTENLFGTSSGSSYEKIGSRKNYSHSVSEMSLVLPVEWKSAVKGHSLYASLRADYGSDSEQLTDLHRSTDIEYLSGSLDVIGQIRCSTMTMITAGINGKYTKTNAQTPQWGDLNFSTALGKSVKSNYNMLSSDSYRLGTYFRVAHAVAGKIAGFTAAYIYTGYSNQSHTDNVTITLSLNF